MKQRRLIVLAVTVSLLTGCATFHERFFATPGNAMVPEIRPGVLVGYLPANELPPAVAFVPPPPRPDSPEMAADIAANQRVLGMQKSGRFALARRDVPLDFPEAATRFQCELGTRVNEEETPVLYRMLRRSMVDAGLATYSAKNYYQRSRPFMQNGQPTCTPETEARLREDGSYPSGHAAIGWAWSLILSGLAPDQSGPVLARGWSFGQSRAICNVHWQSDVDAGRLVAAATVARLHTDPVFRVDFALAREELASARERGLQPEVDCN